MEWLIKKFKKFLTKKGLKKKKEDEEKEGRNVIYYKCNNRGHYKLDCLLLKQNPKRTMKRAMLGI